MTLQWEIPSGWGNSMFNVYFSPGGSANYTRLNPSPLANPFYKDLTTRDYSRFDNGNYVVEALLPGARVVVSRPTFAQYKRRDRIDRIAAEIQRREFLLLSKFAGIKAFYFKKRHYGIRCSRCWNQSIEKVMDDHCTVCFGTSWQGGYFDPIPVFIQFEPTPSARVKGYVGEIEPNSISAWTIAMPEIHSDDILIRTGDFSIYKVIAVNSTELQTRPVRQTMSLTQLSKSDVENNLANTIQVPGSIEYLINAPGVFASKRFPTNLIDMNPDNDPEWAKKQQLINLPKYDL